MIVVKRISRIIFLVGYMSMDFLAWGEYFWNEVNGTFQRNQSIDFPDSDGYYIGIWRFKPADLNADTRIDLFLAGCCGGGTCTGPMTGKQ